MIKRISRIVMMGTLLLLASASCVTEDDATLGTDQDPAALTAEAAGVDEAASCGSTAIDQTDPLLARMLAGAQHQALGLPTIDYVDGVRRSKAQFEVAAVEGAEGTLQQGNVTIECTSTCGGGGMCSGGGCDASWSGCSTHTCFGSSCSGNCTKKSTYSETPRRDIIEEEDRGLTPR